MLEGKDYNSIDMGFLFIDAFIDRETDCVEQVPLTTVHIAYANLLSSLMLDKAAAAGTSGYFSELENHKRGLKQTANVLFETLTMKITSC